MSIFIRKCQFYIHKIDGEKWLKWIIGGNVLKMNFQYNNEQKFYNENKDMIDGMLENLHTTFLKLICKNLTDNIGLLWIAHAMNRKHPQIRILSINQEFNDGNPLFNLNVLMDMTSGSQNTFTSLFAKALIEMIFENLDFAYIVAYLLKTDLKNEVFNWDLSPIDDAYGYYLVPYVHITHRRLSQVEIFLKMKPLSKLVEP